MVTSHQRKRLNGVSVPGFNSLDQQRTKRKKSELQKSNLKGKSLVSLEWDDNQRKVVAKREQIRISHRDMTPFIDPALMHHCDLAYVFTIPQEVLELENLVEALPYQVWQNHLSRKEKFLMQFLPERQDTEEVVQKLFSGDNFHFGNPLLKWSASLCSGNLHPDSVLHQERSLKYHKKAYYLDLKNYHKSMIQYLQKLKDAWEDTSVLEKEALPKIRRSRKYAERRISLHSNSPEFDEPEDNVLATSKSCSLVAEEKACSSDNQNSNIIKSGELPNRIHEKGRKLMVSSNDAIHQSDDLQKCDMYHTDMLCLKISKKQLNW